MADEAGTRRAHGVVGLMALQAELPLVGVGIGARNRIGAGLQASEESRLTRASQRRPAGADVAWARWQVRHVTRDDVEGPLVLVMVAPASSKDTSGR